MAEDAAATGEESQPKKKFKIPTTAVIVIVVALVEGLAFYGVTSFLGGGPQAAHGVEDGDNYTAGEDPTQVVETAEIELLSRFKVPNDKRGQAFMYDLDVYIKVPAAEKEATTAFVESRAGEISDRIARIIRASDPPMLHEPELKTLRLKIQHVLNELIGDTDTILEILIPRCVPMRAG